MITLITGQPGAGKTLLTIDELRKVQDRPIFYSGIPDLKLPWQELKDPEQWHKSPPGSIVVIDEAQRVFRPRGNGATVPEHVSALETHRHTGIDLYVITQHPMLVDANVRRLAGLHRHVMRAFGAGVANVHEWQEVNTQPDKTRKDSIVKTRAYPKDVYNLYKSAEVHTHKVRLPLRLLVLLVAPLILGACIWAFMHWQNTRAKTQQELIEGKPQVTGIAQQNNSNPPAENALPSDKKPSYDDLGSFAPRVDGIPESAPRYDHLTVAIRAPSLGGCLATPARCRCYTPTGARYHTTDTICRDVVAHGVPFNDWSPEERPGGRVEPGGARHATDLVRSRSEERPAQDFRPADWPSEPTILQDHPTSMSMQTALALRAMQRPGE